MLAFKVPSVPRSLASLAPYLFAFALLAIASGASAQSGANRAAAEALFEEGRRLMAENQLEEACRKFESSQRLDPGVGTLLNVADCYAKSGRTASAWAAFREAGSAARAQGSAERENVARERAAALEPQLSYLTIVQWKGQSVAITRNGNPVDPAMLDTPMPVDPGEHIVVAASPGKREWSTKVNVGPNGQRASVTIPILPDEPIAMQQPQPAEKGVAVDTGGSSPGQTQRYLAIGAGVVGVAGIVVGTIFGLNASSDWDEAQKCDEDPMCGNAGTLSDDASSAATISTVGFIVGGLGLAGGAVLWLTAPSEESNDPDRASVSVGLGLQGLTVRGSM
jgi:hypothetical protein